MHMNAGTGSSDTRTDTNHKPLIELLQRARRSKRITNEDDSAESKAARAAYAQLGKLIGQ